MFLLLVRPYMTPGEEVYFLHLFNYDELGSWEKQSKNSVTPHPGGVVDLVLAIGWQGFWMRGRPSRANCNPAYGTSSRAVKPSCRATRHERDAAGELMRKQKYLQCKSWPPLLGLTIAAFFLASCGGYTVSKWDGWCSQLRGEDLYAKYHTGILSFDHTAIRTDFVRRLQSTVIGSVVDSYFPGKDPETDPVLKELIRLRLVGVWIDGDDLHIADSFVVEDAEYQSWVTQWRKHLNPDTGKTGLKDEEYCVYR